MTTTTDRSERNLIRFSVADADLLLGREATESEIESITKTLANDSYLTEIFHEAVMNGPGFGS